MGEEESIPFKPSATNDVRDRAEFIKNTMVETERKRSKRVALCRLSVYDSHLSNSNANCKQQTLSTKNHSRLGWKSIKQLSPQSAQVREQRQGLSRNMETYIR